MNPKTSLHIVLVLTFIGSGSSFLAYLTAGIFYDTFLQTLSVMAQVSNEMAVAADTLKEMPRLLFISMGLFYGLSLLGAIEMWHLRKTGFHFYTLSQLVLLSLPALFMGKAYFAIGDAMLTLMFVAYYWFSLRRLNVFNHDSDKFVDEMHPTDQTDTDH